jgi:UDP-N-acetylmuramoyl-tripeptide--D-alanyl-D-alanine ligase
MREERKDVLGGIKDVVDESDRNGMRAVIKLAKDVDAKKILASASNLTVIGITGSCGKTSMKYYLNTILSTKFDCLMTPGSCNTPLGIVRIIRERLKATHEIFICEMGARRCGEIKEICDIVHPKHGIVTAVAGQHLETFGSLENIRKTKYELLNSLPSDGFGFVNGDSTPIKECLPNIDGKLFVYGSNEGDDFVISDLKLNPCASFKLNGVEFRTKLLGAHNALNVAGAVAIAIKLGMSIEDCAKAASLITGVSKRLELKESLEATVIDDAFNSNPEGSMGALEALSRFEGCRILVTPGMFELGSKQYEFNFNFGKKAASVCDVIILMGINSKAIADGAISVNFSNDKIILLDNLEAAKAAALNYKDDRHKVILFENSLPDHC